MYGFLIGYDWVYHIPQFQGLYPNLYIGGYIITIVIPCHIYIFVTSTSIVSGQSDDFGILFLDSIPAGFVVYLTDKGVLEDGSLRSGEGILQFSGEVPGRTLRHELNMN